MLRSVFDHEEKAGCCVHSGPAWQVLLASPAMTDFHPYDTGQDIRNRTFVFACRVVEFCEPVYAAGGIGRLLVPQLLSCSTSPAGMLEEARAAESKRDFISKCCIALKELRESWTRLRILEASRIGSRPTIAGLVKESNELIAIVGTIIRNTRRNAKPSDRNRGRRSAADQSIQNA